VNHTISNNSDIPENEADEWQRGNDYRRSEWLAQLRLMDGSEQSRRYDSSDDNFRIWAHAPFYPVWTCPYSLRYHICLVLTSSSLISSHEI
jgi:hypothetical protein